MLPDATNKGRDPFIDNYHRENHKTINNLQRQHDELNDVSYSSIKTINCQKDWDYLKELNERAEQAIEIQRDSNAKEIVRVKRPKFDFPHVYGADPFERPEHRRQKGEIKISNQYKGNCPSYKLGYDFLKQMNSERYDYKYKYEGHGTTNGPLIREKFGP